MATNRETYTAPELEALAEKLSVLNERVKKFLQTAALVDIIERNMEVESFECPNPQEAL
jgi:hypothetical protein